MNPLIKYILYHVNQHYWIAYIFIRPASTIGVVRTAKAERRLKDQLRENGLLTNEDDGHLTLAEERALKAEKRAAWRQARLKSLEQDAIQAQMVIKSMTDLVEVTDIQQQQQQQQLTPAALLMKEDNSEVRV